MQTQIHTYESDHKLETLNAKAWLAAELTFQLNYTQKRIRTLEERMGKWDEIIQEEENPWPDRIIEIANENWMRLNELMQQERDNRSKLSEDLYRVLSELKGS